MCEPFLQNEFTEQKQFMFNNAIGLLTVWGKSSVYTSLAAAANLEAALVTNQTSVFNIVKTYT